MIVSDSILAAQYRKSVRCPGAQRLKRRQGRSTASIEGDYINWYNLVMVVVQSDGFGADALGGHAFAEGKRLVRGARYSHLVLRRIRRHNRRRNKLLNCEMT